MKQILILFCYLNLLLLCGDVELNPGPSAKDSYSCYNFSLCHWNLNSITAHDFSKVSLLEAFNAVHKFDIFCLTETYLDNTVPSDELKLQLDGLQAG